jgi:D-alanine-D-alanine ligase
MAKAKKINIAVIFGGQSAEHEISLLSARNIIAALNRKKYAIIPVGIDSKGNFFVFNLGEDFLLHADNPKSISLSKKGERVTFAFGQTRELVRLTNKKIEIKIDVAFPVLHGTFGEDGAIQGLLKIANIPFVGASVLGSAVGFDKEVAKRLCRDAGIQIADFLTFNLSERSKIVFSKIKAKLGLPFFIKPSNAGSSIGVSKIKSKADFSKKVKESFRYGNKVIFEKAIQGKEIECSVLGNENPIASLPGRVIPKKEFYSYSAKYLDENGANFDIPAKLPKQIVKKIQEIAVRVYKILNCEGMARVEINTIPGFTSISMYPKLWEVSGIKKTELLDRLIALSMERSRREKKIKTTY